MGYLVQPVCQCRRFGNLCVGPRLRWRLRKPWVGKPSASHQLATRLLAAAFAGKFIESSLGVRWKNVGKFIGNSLAGVGKPQRIRIEKMKEVKRPPL
ncbi:hypothetical protein GW17_00038797 [Ensete ventricosum]|nr:hypothetical protein GW17_00038797 [Ensete ventricosum]